MEIKPNARIDTNNRSIKLSWKNLQKANYTCNTEGRHSDQCKRILKEMNIDLVED